MACRTHSIHATTAYGTRGAGPEQAGPSASAGSRRASREARTWSWRPTLDFMPLPARTGMARAAWTCCSPPIAAARHDGRMPRPHSTRCGGDGGRGFELATDEYLLRRMDPPRPRLLEAPGEILHRLLERRLFAENLAGVMNMWIYSTFGANSLAYGVLARARKAKGFMQHRELGFPKFGKKQLPLVAQVIDAPAAEQWLTRSGCSFSQNGICKGLR